MTEDDLRQCIQHKPSKFLCKKNMPSYDLHSNNAPCEAKLLSHQNIARCDVDHASCKEVWIELHSPNSWLTTCCDVCSLRTICNDDVTSSTISSSSIVTLSQGCILQSKDLTIYAHRQYNSHMKMDYEFSMPTLNTSINNIVNLTYHYAQNTLHPIATTNNLQQIEDKLEAQKDSEARHHMTISSHDVHQYIISYLLLASAVVTFVVVVGRKRCRLCLTKQRETMPTEQRHEDIELQEYSRQRTTRTASPCQDDVHHADHESETARRAFITGTKNIAFNFD